VPAGDPTLIDQMILTLPRTGARGTGFALENAGRSKWRPAKWKDARLWWRQPP